MDDSLNKASPGHMTRAEYARHRGVSGPAVTQYAHAGRLVETADGLVDVEATDELLAAVLNPVHGGDRTGKRNPAAAPSTAAYLEARISRELALGSKAALEAEHLAGNLVRVDEVEREAFSVARQAQEALSAIPDRLASLLAAESDPAKVHELLTDEILRVVSVIATDDGEGMP